MMHDDKTTRREVIFFVAMPLALFFLYLLGMAVVPRPGYMLYSLVHGESPYGIVENATALSFSLGALLFLFACWRGASIPWTWRWGYLALAAAALFVALEEINYGQYFFRFETPDFIEEFNCKHEFNLHNMFGNKPARRLNLLATIGFPMLFIFLPLLRGWRGLPPLAAKLSDWFLPRRQLMLFVILAQLCSWLDDIFGWFGIANAWTRATELKELFWGLGVLSWAGILWRRMATPPPGMPTPQAPRDDA
jgi:hypothetical protein